MVMWMIDASGNDEQRAKWVPGLASMQELGSYCLTEPWAGSDAAALSTRAVLNGDEAVRVPVANRLGADGDIPYRDEGPHWRAD